MPEPGSLHTFAPTMPPELKILLVGDFPPPNGGVATHVEELYRAVRARGGQCEVLDIGKGQLPADGVVPSGSMSRFAVLLGSYAARGFRIHLHTNGANPRSWLLAGVCAAASRAAMVPAMITLHSGLGPAWLRQSKARRAIAQSILRQYGTVIAVNQEIRDALGLPGIEVLPAFSSEFLQPGLPPAGLPELRKLASPLFCAMLAPRPEYGERVLLRAFELVLQKLPAAQLALYGLGTEDAKGACIHGFGELARPQALALISACDVFVRPTLADGDSVSVREALALGRVVVATRVGNRPEGVRLVPPGDGEALARGLLESAGSEPPKTVAADGLQGILGFYSALGSASCAASAAS